MIIDGLANAITKFILFGIVLVLRKSINNEGLDSFLIHTDRKGIRLFLKGIIAGVGLFAIYPALLVIFGLGEITINKANAVNTLLGAISLGIGYLAVALFEEALFRGYIFLKLVKRYSLTIGLVISSVLFGAAHVISYSESQYFWVGLINAALIGALLCLIVTKTGSLMLAIGFHLAWNLTQNLMLFNTDTLLSLNIQENRLTGAGGIPETGIFVTGIIVISVIYILMRGEFIKNNLHKKMEDSV